MYRWLTICLAASGWCEAMVASIRNDEENSNEHSTVARANQATASQYFYPIYSNYDNNRYPVQRGYEGYLVPADLSWPQTTDSYPVTEIVTSLLPLSGEILFYGVRTGAAYLLHFIFVIFLGGAFTTIICTFTSICTIDFLGIGVVKNQVKEQVAELARGYVSTEAVNAATLFVSKALEKYAAMQENAKRKEA